MRISDWSSDVCSSDLLRRLEFVRTTAAEQHVAFEAGTQRGIIIEQEIVIVAVVGEPGLVADRCRDGADRARFAPAQHVLERLQFVDSLQVDRKSVVWGKRV